jgi:hypothetical protein
VVNLGTGCHVMLTQAQESRGVNWLGLEGSQFALATLWGADYPASFKPGCSVHMMYST